MIYDHGCSKGTCIGLIRTAEIWVGTCVQQDLNRILIFIAYSGNKGSTIVRTGPLDVRVGP